jgi:hypothetical protein
MVGHRLRAVPIMTTCGSSSSGKLRRRWYGLKALIARKPAASHRAKALVVRPVSRLALADIGVIIPLGTFTIVSIGGWRTTLSARKIVRVAASVALGDVALKRPLPLEAANFRMGRILVA